MRPTLSNDAAFVGHAERKFLLGCVDRERAVVVGYRVFPDAVTILERAICYRRSRVGEKLYGEGSRTNLERSMLMERFCFGK